MNVEGYILGIVWLLVVGNKIDDKIYEHSYGNRIRKNLLDDKGQSTYSPYLFEPYFQQYENWRDTALNYAQKSLNKNQDVVILMLDFQRFFYQVDISQKELISFVNTITNDEDCQLNDEYKELAIRLTRFIWNVIERYSNTLRKECPNLIENRNTNYYSNIVESLSRDLHCFCIQVNTSEFGDSRITRPSKTEERDILKVKGGRNSAVLIDTIDISGLREFQIKGNVLQAKSPDSKYYKQTPPTFDSNIAKQKQQCALWNEFDSKA